MGGSQSSRKISVENENAIQVSQEAIDRLQAQLNSNVHQTQQHQHQVNEQPSPPAYYSPSTFYDYELQKREKELAAEEEYWTRRIDHLKLAHVKINNSMETEYQKTLKQANELFSKVQSEKITNSLPCQDEKAKVLQCYSTNPNKSLLCSALVNRFNDCVCQSRIATVTAS